MSGITGRANARRGLFLWGAALAWVPVVVIAVPAFISTFGGITNQKATGLGAVAGGFSEAFVTFGVGAFVAAQLLAIIFLVRTFGNGGTVQSLFSILSIGLSVVTLVVTGLFLWLMLVIIPRLNSR